MGFSLTSMVFGTAGGETSTSTSPILIVITAILGLQFSISASNSVLAAPKPSDAAGSVAQSGNCIRFVHEYSGNGFTTAELKSAEPDILKSIASNDISTVRNWIWAGVPRVLFADTRYKRLFDQIALEKTLILDSASGNLSKIDTDIKLGAQINIVPVDDEWGPPLTWAVECGRYDAANRLLKDGANPNLRGVLISNSGTIRNYTPLMEAAGERNRDVVRLLLRYGADPNMQAASSEQSLPTPGTLRFPRHSEATALTRAVGDPATIALLLDAGARPDVAEQDGRTALFWAAEQNDLKSATLLLQHCANPTLTDIYGETAAEVAQQHGNMQLTIMLRKSAVALANVH